MPEPTPADVTRLLRAAAAGDPDAPDALLPLVYEHLRRIAAAQMAGERPGHTLQATALVHEAYLRLIGPEPPDFPGRGPFFAAAAEAMRRILVDHARRRGRRKRGGGRARVPLDVVDLAADADSPRILALDDALRRLLSQDARMHEVVMLRFFAGLGIEHTAEVLGVSPRTVKRDWMCARAWLYRELGETPDAGEDPMDGRASC